MLTGVIYGAIVVVWAAYLVPLALRRHDEASRTRSIARFSSAMRVLARRGSTLRPSATERTRVVVTPPRDEPRVLAPETAPAGSTAPRQRPTRAAERAAAARRRRVLAVLLGLTGMVFLISLFGLLPLWSVVVPGLLVVAFLVIARRSVRLVDEAYWAEVAAATEEPSSVVVRRSVARVDASRAAADVDEPTVTVTSPQQRRDAREVHAEREHVVAVALATPEGGSLWDPLPVTLPTYVSAPVAKRTFRTIDLAESGTRVVASGATAAANGATAAPASRPSPDDEETGEIPRVVNG